MDTETNKNFPTTEQFEMIIKSLQLLNANVKKEEVLKNIVDVAISITNADRGTLYLVNKEKYELWSKILFGENIKEINLKIGEGIAGWVAEKGEIINLIDVKSDERFDPSFDESTGYETKNMLVYPIKNKNEETVGVLQLLNSFNGRFSQNDEKLLDAISLNISLALDNAALVEKLISVERDNSIGKMGNFINYDIKKPLLTCKRYVEHLLKKEHLFEVKQIIKLLNEQLEQISSQLSSTTYFTEGTTLLRREPVSLNDTLYDFSLRINNLLKEYRCNVENNLKKDVIINIDKNEFYQCYYNIIKNACEAYKENGTILISTKIEGDNILIDFNDKGIGIEESDIEHVFEPLWSKNKNQGSGLGLAISKKIVEDHNGKINITSDKETGTTVTILLPIE
ncbi:MAG: hypothetical protein CR986_00430 [Ignavibacteriae bacterium]|nr:MAG: hypothetical protein CR986_00430 [Ignavibacteriota bacterium]